MHPNVYVSFRYSDKIRYMLYFIHTFLFTTQVVVQHTNGVRNYPNSTGQSFIVLCYMCSAGCLVFLAIANMLNSCSDLFNNGEYCVYVNYVTNVPGISTTSSEVYHRNMFSKDTLSSKNNTKKYIINYSCLIECSIVMIFTITTEAVLSTLVLCNTIHDLSQKVMNPKLIDKMIFNGTSACTIIASCLHTCIQS